jgi:tRNA threonylcarbamoyladenosine biosynthesis protein TsaE
VSAAPEPDAGAEAAARWITADEQATRLLGRTLAGRLLPDGVLLLTGDLGAGKTVLAQGVASALGIDPREVVSPTYTLIREHRGPGGRLVHVDLYRLEPAEVLEIGIDEALAGDGVKVVEWAERLPFPSAFGGAVLRLELRRRADGGRDVRELPEPGTIASSHRE